MLYYYNNKAKKRWQIETYSILYKIIKLIRKMKNIPTFSKAVLGNLYVFK